MSVACILRCDNGGLGNISREIVRHLTPERVLLVDLHGSGRGPCDPAPFDLPEIDLYRTDFLGGLNAVALDWITSEGVDVLFGMEVWYEGYELAGQGILARAHNNGLRSVLYAMPELSPWCVDSGLRPRPHTFAVPTAWRLDTMPHGTTVLPLPVARDRLPFTHRSQVASLYHVAAPAMLDRNGTDLFLTALPFVTEEVFVTIRNSSDRGLVIPRCRADVEVIDKPADHYWQIVPDHVDLLVQPRRYGGLSLPVQECASLGIPTLLLDSDPYAMFDFAHVIPNRGSRDRRMKGGMVPVYDADPRALAAKIDQLVRDPTRQQAASHAADAWAEAHAWDSPLGARWCATLAAGCQEAAA
jgi:hypothetical protein